MRFPVGRERSHIHRLLTNITERIIQDEDAARQKYGEIDFDQTTKDWEEIRKMTVLSCQEQKF